ncbi:MAG TPA: HAD-IA family hydrolase [Syntrophorhabdales bacterium]|nr:HAD-IA family hydrolase [Syntrophorhabdales bacterium]
MAVRLIIFDLDGTLIDSVEDICGAVNYAIEPHGLAPVTLEETRASVGEGVPSLIEKVLTLKKATFLDTEALTKRVLEYYSSHLVAKTAPYPEVRETLEHLGACRKAVISNKLTGLAERILEALDLRKYFEVVAGSDSCPERKPSPVPVLRVLSLLDVPPQEALIVGDSVYDMAAGRAAGLGTVAVTYGYGTPGFSEGCDFVIDRFSELLEVVQGLEP